MSANLIQVETSQLTGMIKDIATFLNDHRDRIIEARAQKGGWEGWLQVELASFLLRTNGMRYDILREQMIYVGTERVDIWAQPASGQRGIPFLGIELKVESEYQVGVNKTLQDRLKTDILKCNNGPKVAFKAGQGTHLYAVGITSLEADLAAYKEIAIATGQLICYCPLIVDRDYGIRNIFLIWWAKEFRQ
ncbi:hypothetical protein BKA65DRAFT_94711 [Rhexocercosporidium sp. MPI-PUGE-AT-0058]|nr:hypothetical protein BKA65DRAFT_94711 [Rhexocercosporidium sp. MPI-PUGE-AT-0058]